MDLAGTPFQRTSVSGHDLVPATRLTLYGLHILLLVAFVVLSAFQLLFAEAGWVTAVQSTAVELAVVFVTSLIAAVAFRYYSRFDAKYRSMAEGGEQAHERFAALSEVLWRAARLFMLTTIVLWVQNIMNPVLGIWFSLAPRL